MGNQKKSKIINICIVPGRGVSKTCEEISQSLNSDSVMFTLGSDRFAHITVFMARFADENVEKVIKIVEKVTESVESFDCVHTGYFLTEGRYLEASYRKSPSLTVLHESLIQGIAGLRYSPGDPYQEDYFAPYTADQQSNAEETGYDLARSLFRPHITLTRYAEGKVPNFFPAFPEVSLSFELSEICIYEADDNGAICKKLASFSIKLGKRGSGGIIQRVIK